METHNCIDLSERLQALYEETPDFDEMLHRIMKQAGFDALERVYLGSSFCGNYFLHLKAQMASQLIELCNNKNIKLSLVIPTFTEKNLDKGKNKIAEYEKWFGSQIDEIVVNDYGMMAYIHSTYGNRIKLVMGRLFMKDYREPRYTEYFNQVLYPKIFTKELDKLIEKYEIRGMLFDRTHREIDFSHKPSSIEIGIYEPYTYITVGQICELGSSHQPIEKKFRPNNACQEECSSHEMHYFVEDGRKWLRIGRTIYFENRDAIIAGLSSYRRIYCPFEKEVRS